MSKLNKTLLVVTPYFPPYGGGLERYAFEITRLLSQEYNWRIIILTSGDYQGVDKINEVEGMKIYRLSYGLKISNTPFSLNWLKKIPQILKNEKPDVINIHTPVPGIGDITAFFSKKIPFVITYHTGSMRKNKFFVDFCIDLYEKFFMRKLLNEASFITCSSDFVRLNFLGRYLYKSVTITPAIDINVFHPDISKKATEPTVLFVAGLGKSEQHKGLKILITAIEIISKKLPTIKLRVVGDGNMRSEYEKIVKQKGLSSLIYFTGRLNGDMLTAEYQKAHVFALPTINESFSIAILEAMASALPVVSTNVGGVPLLVSHNKTGFLIPTQDSEALAVYLLDLFNDQKKIEEFGNNGKEKAANGFSWQFRANILNGILENVIKPVILKDKVAIVTPYFYPKVGGLENYALDMARGLKKDGKDVFIITSNHFSKGWKFEEIEGMRVYRMPIILRISNTPIHPFWKQMIRTIIRNEKPLVINAHTPVPFIADAAERARGKVPFVLTYHNDLTKPGLILNLICKIEYFLLSNKTLRNSDRIIATSKYYADHSPYLQPVIKKIAFVPPGVDSDRFKINLETPNFDTKFSQHRTILFVGQMDKTHNHKGLDELLVAVSKIKETIPEIMLVAVGKGDNIDTYRQTAKALGIENNVSFEGFISNELLPQYYAGADVLALPSRDQAEGFGMVIIEAAACGTPTVATNVGGIPAAIQDGVTGLLIPPSDSQALVDALQMILKDGVLREKLGYQANKRVEQEFTLPIVTRKFSEIINSIKIK